MYAAKNPIPAAIIPPSSIGKNPPRLGAGVAALVCEGFGAAVAIALDCAGFGAGAAGSDAAAGLTGGVGVATRCSGGMESTTPYVAFDSVTFFAATLRLRVVVVDFLVPGVDLRVFGAVFCVFGGVFRPFDGCFTKCPPFQRIPLLALQKIVYVIPPVADPQAPAR